MVNFILESKSVYRSGPDQLVSVVTRQRGWSSLWFLIYLGEARDRYVKKEKILSIRGDENCAHM